MEIGKISNELLNKIILGKLKNKRSEIILRPKIGEDCCAVDFEKYACVLSTDPITGAVSEIGRLAVHISCNDIASCGVEPIGLMVTILIPPSASEEDLAKVMRQISETADTLNVDIIGGHTEVTSSVTRFVIVSTALGRILKNNIVSTSGAKPGDAVIMTKTAGIEGTAIIAHDREEELLRIFDKETINNAKSFVDRISVVKEGVIAGSFGVSSMHDVTEGGLLGAAWETAQASGVGIKIFRKKVPVEKETLEITNHYGIDPLKLISSGCMLITCNDGPGLVKKLQEEGVQASEIGIVSEERELFLVDEDKILKINPPESDELYKVIA